jgi:hypothetical protein
MKHGWIIAGTAAAILVPGLAACSGSSSGGAGSSSTSAVPQTTTPGASGGSATPAASGASDASSGSGRLTPPSTHLGLGQEATVGWVPTSEAGGSGAQKGLRLQVTVESIEKGTIGDFTNVQLNASERKSTPYYVKVRMKALGHTPPSGTDNDPAIAFNAIDDRGQQQDNVIFFGTFQRCNDNTMPKKFASGKTYDSCLAYLIPGGGSIQSVQWNDGPSKANDVTPYFDKPLVWAGS